ncbi:MAG: ABC transporter permease [Firmicutes bacterium]|nr:ABC transporter permease [Bacillota bacterium]
MQYQVGVWHVSQEKEASSQRSTKPLKTANWWQNYLRPTVILLGMGILWEVIAAAGLFPPYILPAPADIATALYQAALQGRLQADIFWSIYRVVSGFVLAMLTGIPLAFLMGWWPMGELLLYPVFYTLRPIPPMAWLPVAIIWLGIGVRSEIFITFLGSFFPIILNTTLGVKSVERRLIEFAQTMGASTWQMITKVVLPAAMPAIFAGMRTGLGVGWMSVVAAEMISAKAGLGYLIYAGRYSLDTALIMGGMLTIGVLGLLMDVLMRRLENKVLAWRSGVVKRV